MADLHALKKGKVRQALSNRASSATPEDQLSERVRHLDALLCLVTVGSHDSDGFRSLNDSLQMALLDLASSLAREVYDLHAEIHLVGGGAR